MLLDSREAVGVCDTSSLRRRRRRNRISGFAMYLYRKPTTSAAVFGREANTRALKPRLPHSGSSRWLEFLAMSQPSPACAIRLSAHNTGNFSVALAAEDEKRNEFEVANATRPAPQY